MPIKEIFRLLRDEQGKTEEEITEEDLDRMKQHFKIFVLKNGDTKFYTIDHSTRTYLYDRNKTLRLLIPGNLEKNKIEQDLKTIAYTF